MHPHLQTSAESMPVKEFRLTLFALLIATVPTLARADWPARVFVPYLYLGNGDHFKMTDCDDAIGVKHYTLAFVIADRQNEPAWYGRVPMSQNLYGDQIADIRQRGGDVICSFGGEAGRELAIAEMDEAKLQAKYQSVIDQYHFTWLDFDIEGNNLSKNPDASKRRNTVLAAIQKKNPGLMITYTLPVSPDGLSQASRDLLTDAKAKGLKVYSANIMVMYFGMRRLQGGKKESDLCVEAANSAHAQIQQIDPTIQIGLCPCIGTNGKSGEIFTTDDAKVLRAFADKNPWVCSLSYWSINRDSKTSRGPDTTAGIPQQPWDFAKVFASF